MLNKKRGETVISVNTEIGENAVIEGKISLVDAININGKVLGNVISEGDIIIGESGNIIGDIFGKNIMVSGSVRGNLKALEQLTLHTTCKVEGDIISNSLVIDDGAKFFGSCKMNDKPSPSKSSDISASLNPEQSKEAGRNTGIAKAAKR